MNAGRWIGALAAVVAIDIAIGLVMIRMGLEENCDNGIARWECSDSLYDLLGASAITITSIYVISLVIAIARARLGRREHNGR